MDRIVSHWKNPVYVMANALTMRKYYLEYHRVQYWLPYSSCYILTSYLLSLILIHDADYLQMTAYSTELLTVSKTNYSCRRT